MSFIELIRVTCDSCDDVLIVPQTSAPNGTLFHSHAQALKFAERQGWYVDAQVVHCGVCRDFALQWHEVWSAPGGLTCCVCGERIPWHHAVINCGDRGVACLSHEGELREWAKPKRCTYCGNRAVASVDDKPLCAAHAEWTRTRLGAAALRFGPEE